MNNYERLRETKIVYEYINDLLTNGNLSLSEIDYNAIETTMDILQRIYSNTHILMKNDKQEDLELLKTDLKCPHCIENVIISDLIDYAYLCENCDENFYLCEGDLDYEWYFNDKYKDELSENILLDLAYNKNDRVVTITTNENKKVQYKCKNVSDLSRAIEFYAKSYLTYDDNKKYYINMWINEQDRDDGYMSTDDNSFDSLEKAINYARNEFDANHYSSLEIVDSNRKAYFCKDSESEDFFLNGLKICFVSNDILNKYIDCWNDNKPLPLDENLLYSKSGNKYIAINNTSDDCFVEEFDKEEDAKNWLLYEYTNEGMYYISI